MAAADSPIDEAWARLGGLIADLLAASKDGYRSRELSLAITKLQEASFWLAVAPDAPNTPQQES